MPALSRGEPNPVHELDYHPVLGPHQRNLQ